VNCAALSESQNAGQEGVLSAAMGAYLAWIAPQYERLQVRLRERARGLQDGDDVGAVHARLPAIVAQLQSGWETWLEFALEAGAISNAEQLELQQRGRSALAEMIAAQSFFHQASDPAQRFLNLLGAALASGHAHLADRNGGVPESPDQWGWQQQPKRWLPRGIRIGWVHGNDLFLDPETSYDAAQQIAGRDRFAITPKVLRHRLWQQKLLASTDTGRGMLLVRRRLENCPSGV